MRKFSATLRSKNHPEKEKYVFFVVLDSEQWKTWKTAKQSMMIAVELKERKYGVILTMNPEFIPATWECKDFSDRVDQVIAARCNPVSVIQIDHGLFESFQINEDPDFSLVLMVAKPDQDEKEVVQEFLNRTKKFRS